MNEKDRLARVSSFIYGFWWFGSFVIVLFLVLALIIDEVYAIGMLVGFIISVISILCAVIYNLIQDGKDNAK